MKPKKSVLFIVMVAAFLVCVMTNDASAKRRSQGFSIFKDPRVTSIIQGTGGIAVIILLLAVGFNRLGKKTRKKVNPHAVHRTKLCHIIKKLRARKMAEPEIEALLLAKGYGKPQIADAVASYNSVIGAPSHWFDKVTEPFAGISIVRKIRRRVRRRILKREIKRLLSGSIPPGDIDKILIQQGWQPKHVYDAIDRYNLKSRKNG